MDQRYLRYQYFIAQSGRGNHHANSAFRDWDPWHRWGSYGRWVRSKPKYKNHRRGPRPR